MILKNIIYRDIERKLQVLICGPKMTHLPHYEHNTNFPLKPKIVNFIHSLIPRIIIVIRTQNSLETIKAPLL